MDNQLVPTDLPYSSELLENVLSQLAVRYPWIEMEEIGRSVMGRPITAVRLGQGKIQVFYNAAFHANEWITTPVLLRFMEVYADAYTNRKRLYGVDAGWLYREFSLYLVPMVNPDGVDLVTGALTPKQENAQQEKSTDYYEKARSISENYPQIPFPDGWKANIDGIDLNLQYPAGWLEARRIKFAQGYTSPAPRDFVGEGPLTAPESLAIYNFTQAHEFQLILAYHTQGEVIYWKYLNYDPPGARAIANYFGEVSGYTVEETPLTSGFAGYKDWFIQDYNRPGYTIEVGRGINPLPLEQFEEIYWDNVGILVGGMVRLIQ